MSLRGLPKRFYHGALEDTEEDRESILGFSLFSVSSVPAWSSSDHRRRSLFPRKIAHGDLAAGFSQPAANSDLPLTTRETRQNSNCHKKRPHTNLREMENSLELD